MNTLSGALVLCLALSVTACAAPSVALRPVLCQHPVVSADTNEGLARGLLDYHAAVELCNALNSTGSDT